MMNPVKNLNGILLTGAILAFLVLSISACSVNPINTPSPALPSASGTEANLSPVPSESQSPDLPTSSQAASETPPSTPTSLPPGGWKFLPIIPAGISDRAREIYRQGLEMGNNPHVFSRIGDCASAAPAFLVGFDRNYNLGEYADLQPAIDYFQGSFERPSLAAKAGLNTAGVLTTLWTGDQCLSNENLLDCQYRLDNPAFAIISLGTNEAYYVHRDPDSFEQNMRLVLDATIARGILPVLATKADNVEGDHSINETISRLAMEYEIPLWNFWLAVQSLPGLGMIEPEHLSSVSYANFTDFSIPHALEYGMQVRNLTALQMLFMLWEQLGSISP